jgi:2,4-dienoyl-CoA reductase-like NADH-dependent reductase (Old Yellow Enzyme family)
MRFLDEIITRTRKKVGPDFPLLVKFNFSDMFRKGLSTADSITICKRLEALGIQGIEVSGGVQETGGLVIIRGEFHPSIVARRRTLPEKLFIRAMAPFIRREGVFQENYFLEGARRIKASVKIPVMVVGGIRNVAAMEQIIENGDADMISMCRPFIRKIDLVNCIRKDTRYVSTCTSCNRCTFEVLNQGNTVKCYYKN